MIVLNVDSSNNWFSRIAESKLIKDFKIELKREELKYIINLQLSNKFQNF